MQPLLRQNYFSGDLGVGNIELVRVVVCIRLPSCFAGSLVVTRCSVRVTIPTDVTNPVLSGGASKRAADASAARILALVFLRVLLAVGLNKHRMFAVLLWALRVHSISAAARFSSASRDCFYSAMSG